MSEILISEDINNKIDNLIVDNIELKELPKILNKPENTDKFIAILNLSIPKITELEKTKTWLEKLKQDVLS